jgi:flagellar biosynthesis anti-sigma factor FlgM
MRSHGDTAHPPVGPSSPQVKTIPTSESPRRGSRGQVTQIDQINLSQRIRDIQQANQVLAQTLEVREAKIVALRRDIESGHYRVGAEQLAEKIVKHHLLDLFNSLAHSEN